MTHAEIILECAHAVRVCVNHYCDEDLSHEGVTAVIQALREALPVQDSGIAYREVVSHHYERFRDRIITPEYWELLDDEEPLRDSGADSPQ